MLRTSDGRQVSVDRIVKRDSVVRIVQDLLDVRRQRRYEPARESSARLPYNSQSADSGDCEQRRSETAEKNSVGEQS